MPTEHPSAQSGQNLDVKVSRRNGLWIWAQRLGNLVPGRMASEQGGDAGRVDDKHDYPPPRAPAMWASRSSRASRTAWAVSNG